MYYHRLFHTKDSGKGIVWFFVDVKVEMRKILAKEIQLFWR